MDRPDAGPWVQMGANFEGEWPGASRLATECVLNMGFVMTRMQQFAHTVVRQYGVPSLAAFNVLTILQGAGESLPPSTIAERMIVTRGTMTTLIDSLERHDLVRRVPHERDRRMVLVELTPEGAERVAKLRPRLHMTEKRWMAPLSASQQQALLDMLTVVQSNAPQAEDI